MKKEKCTIENKERKVNENLMFNVKNVSLMKKQLFSLMVMFALVMGLSISALAQTAAPADPVTGSPGDPRVYLSGATDSLQITRGVPGSQVVWKLYKGTDSITGVLATAADLDLVAYPSWTNTQTNDAADPARFRFKWTDQAAGDYYLQVTETDLRAGRTCAVTVRGYHIWLMGFDVQIYASNEAGDSINLAARSGCGGGTYPAFMNDVVMNVDGAVRGDILNTAANPATNGTALTPIVGEHPTRAIRYFTAELHFDDAHPTSEYANPTVASVRMDVRINVTTINGQDSVYVATINGVNMQGDRASVLNTPVNRNGATGYLYTFPVEFNDSWGDDIVATATVANVFLHSAADGGGNNLGEEPAAYEDFVPDNAFQDNTSNTFTIYGKPNTGPIQP